MDVDHTNFANEESLWYPGAASFAWQHKVPRSAQQLCDVHRGEKVAGGAGYRGIDVGNPALDVEGTLLVAFAKQVWQPAITDQVVEGLAA